MALDVRTYIDDTNGTAKLIDGETLVVCSKYTKAQIANWLLNNYPNVYTKIAGHTVDIQAGTCPHNPTKNHYILFLDR